MNKIIINIFIICIVLTLSGCSTTEDKSFKDAFKRSFSDTDTELEDDYDIEYTLFHRDWVVRIEKKARLAELLRRMISKKGVTPDIIVNEGYYSFQRDVERKGHYLLNISVYCLINNEPRWLFLECGRACVESKYLVTADKWYLSLQDENKQDIEEPWAWCYYTKGEIEDTFWKPYITYASRNYIYMTSGIYLNCY